MDLSDRIETARRLVDQCRISIPGRYLLKWHDMPAELSLQPGGLPDHSLATLTCRLGLLPYTAEDRLARNQAIEMAMGVNYRGWDHIRFTHDGALELTSSTSIARPDGCASLIGSLTVWFMCLDRDLMPLRMLLRPA